MNADESKKQICSVCNKPFFNVREAGNGKKYCIPCFSQTPVYIRGDMKVKRNEKCPCRSGKKFKHCCLAKVS